MHFGESFFPPPISRDILREIADDGVARGNLHGEDPGWLLGEQAVERQLLLGLYAGVEVLYGMVVASNDVCYHHIQPVVALVLLFNICTGTISDGVT